MKQQKIEFENINGENFEMTGVENLPESGLGLTSLGFIITPSGKTVVITSKNHNIDIDKYLCNYFSTSESKSEECVRFIKGMNVKNFSEELGVTPLEMFSKLSHLEEMPDEECEVDPITAKFIAEQFNKKIVLKKLKAIHEYFMPLINSGHVLYLGSPSIVNSTGKNELFQLIVPEDKETLTDQQKETLRYLNDKNISRLGRRGYYPLTVSLLSPAPIETGKPFEYKDLISHDDVDTYFDGLKQEPFHLHTK